MLSSIRLSGIILFLFEKQKKTYSVCFIPSIYFELLEIFVIGTKRLETVKKNLEHFVFFCWNNKYDEFNVDAQCTHKHRQKFQNRKCKQCEKFLELYVPSSIVFSIHFVLSSSTQENLFNRIGVRYTVSLMQSAKTNKDIVRTEIVIVIMCLLLLSNNTIVCLVSWNQISLMLLISTIWYCRWYCMFQLAPVRCFCYFLFWQTKTNRISLKNLFRTLLTKQSSIVFLQFDYNVWFLHLSILYIHSVGESKKLLPLNFTIRCNIHVKAYKMHSHYFMQLVVIVSTRMTFILIYAGSMHLNIEIYVEKLS